MIFYFSGTGNTKWVAQQLAEATGERLCYIPDELKAGVLSYQLKSGERLGFCFPTHGWQPPRIVRDFIRRSAFTWDGSQMPYVFAVTTCGDNMGCLYLGWFPDALCLCCHHLWRQYGPRYAHPEQRTKH